MLHSYLACMHTFFWFSNLHLPNLVCHGLVFAELVLANLSGPNLLYLLELLLQCCSCVRFLSTHCFSTLPLSIILHLSFLTANRFVY